MTTFLDPASQFLTPAELAERWRCSKGHLANLRYWAKGPTYLKLNGGKVLYDIEDIRTYEAARVVAPLKRDA